MDVETNGRGRARVFRGAVCVCLVFLWACILCESMSACDEMPHGRVIEARDVSLFESTLPMGVRAHPSACLMT